MKSTINLKKNNRDKKFKMKLSKARARYTRLQKIQIKFQLSGKTAKIKKRENQKMLTNHNSLEY